MVNDMGTCMVCQWLQLLVLCLMTLLAIIPNFELGEELGTGVGCTEETMKEVLEWDAQKKRILGEELG